MLDPPVRDPTEPSRKAIIGLTGGPGSGKSAAAKLFAAFGCAVIDADRLAHDALQNDAVKGQIQSRWGGDVFDADGQVVRSKLGHIVFEDAVALRELEALVHPLVHQNRLEERQKHQLDPGIIAIVEDCPLLLESGLDKHCDRIVFVDAPDPIRLERVQGSRGWDAEELRKRDRQQLPLDIKRQSADYVICNDQDLAQLKEQVRYVLQSIAEMPTR